MSTITAEGRLLDLIEAEEDRDLHVQTFMHEDGSATIIQHDEFAGERNPRDEYDHLVSLVSDTTGWIPMDAGDHDIEEMRDAASILGDWLTRSELSNVWSLHEVEDEERYEIHLIIETKYGRHWLDLDNEHEARVAAAYFEGIGAQECVERYVDEARPDIACYVHEWNVTGCSQGDWRDGYAFMTREALAEAGYSSNPDRPLNGTLKMRARSIYDSEMKEYAAWFAGEVYCATHVFPVGPEFAIGDEGGYYTGEMLAATEHCGGFIGYGDFEEIASQFTSSPVCK
jgi:hypothetical protein